MFDFLESFMGKSPKAGDAVWWASKCVEGRISAVGKETFTFHAGGPCETPRGNKVANRYTVSADVSGAVYDKTFGGWIVGKGPSPKDVRGKVVIPKPVVIKGGIKNG